MKTPKPNMSGSGLPLCSLPTLGWQPPRAAGIRCRPLPPDEPERKRDKVSPEWRRLLVPRAECAT